MIAIFGTTTVMALPSPTVIENLVEATYRREPHGGLPRGEERTVFGAGNAEFDQVVLGHDHLPPGTKDERAHWSAVVPLALEKRLFLNVRRKPPGARAVAGQSRMDPAACRASASGTGETVRRKTFMRP